MKLASIKAVGFKSFRDPTTIQFDDGVTGIVGPNGCGKSNIVDAISWVLGTTAASQVRGEQMEDMIFSGTTKHSPASFAEVSITFEKDDGTWPDGFEKLSQLEFKRKLERGGPGQYFINGEPCLLRNIQEMLLTAGVSTWSLIKQDTVSQLISSKPEQLRDVLEQVAGTMVFKNKKRQAENKLKLTLQNIEKIVAILTEQQKHLKKLEKQSAQAQIYTDLKTQIREIELKLFKERYEELLRSIEENKVQIKETTSLEQASRKNLEEWSCNHKQAKEDSTRIYEELDSKRATLRKLGKDLTEKEVKVARLKTIIDTSTGNVTISSHKVDLEGFKRKQAKEIDTLKERIQKDQSSALSLQENLKNKKAGMEKLELQVSLLRKQKQEEENQKSQLLKTTLEKEEIFKSFDKNKTRIESAIQETQVGIEDKQSQLSASEEKYQSIFQSLEQKDQSYLKLKEKMITLKESSNQCTQSLKDQKSQLQSKTTLKLEAQSQMKGLTLLQERDEMSQKGEKWVRSNTPLLTLIDLISVETSFEVAVESLLHHKLDSFVIQNKKEALDLMKSAQEESRLSFLFAKPKLDVASIESEKSKVSKEKDFTCFLEEKIQWKQPTSTNNKYNLSKISDATMKEVISSLFQHCVVLSSAQNMQALSTKYPHLTFLTQKGDVAADDYVVFGGSLVTQEQNPFLRQKKIEELSLQIQNLTQECGSLEKEIENQEAALEKIHQEITSLGQIKEDSSLELSKYKQEVSLLQKEIDHLKTSTEELTQKHSNYVQELKELKLSKVSEEDLKQAQEKMKQTEQLCFKAEQNLQDGLQKVDSLKSNIESLTLSLMSVKKDISHREDQVKILTNSIDELEEKQTEFYKNSTEGNESLESHMTHLKKAQEELRTLKEKYSQKEQDSIHYEQRYAQVLEEYNTLGTKISDINRSLEKMSEQRHQNEVEKETLEVEKRNLEEKALEIYQVDLVRYCVPQEFSFESGEEDVFNIDHLQSLKKKLDQIGQVNLIALEEYEELKVENDELQSQYSDLDTSREDLEKVIDEMDKISSEKFKTTFKQVNEKFSQVFSSVFDGGHASLNLVDTGKSDEKGVEILACPPSKRLKSLKLLSGGEKSLTALSLVFSLFLVRLSPFVVLDEVDAALDDMNVARFNSLMTAMADQCQMIIITHNKFSMRECDRLYGVTMQEKGITQLVTVDLKDVKKTSKDLSL